MVITNDAIRVPAYRGGLHWKATNLAILNDDFAYRYLMDFACNQYVACQSGWSEVKPPMNNNSGREPHHVDDLSGCTIGGIQLEHSRQIMSLKNEYPKDDIICSQCCHPDVSQFRVLSLSSVRPPLSNTHRGGETDEVVPQT